MIDNKIIEIVNNYDYANAVNDAVKELKKKIAEVGSNEILSLFPKIDGNIVGETDNEIAEKMAQRVIHYRIREKAFVRLMSEGLIYPVETCNGWNIVSVSYRKPNSVTTGQFNFKRIVFSEFITM